MLKKKYYKALYDYAKGVADSLTDPVEKEMFEKCYLNTLETTLSIIGGVYVKTGDIPAMWLRDSSVQVSHYVRLAGKDEKVAELVKGLLKRQFKCILIDPYANAFNKRANGKGHKDITAYNKNVFERKYEIDSLVYPIWLLNRYYGFCKDASVFDELFFKAYQTIIDTFVKEQKHDELSDYSFIRIGDYSFDSLPRDGKGGETAYTGMIFSAFRPSDDRCEYHYLVPSNMFVVAAFKELLSNLDRAGVQNPLKEKTQKLIKEVDDGIKKYGIVDSPLGKVYAYEVDGLGGVNMMDDANVPGLLSIPYIGYAAKDDPIYLNTRKFVLSKNNPYYFEGKAASGVGSPHTPKNYVWHIALIIQALTSTDEKEIGAIRQILKNTTAGTGFMHEGFDCDDPGKFTRDWFAWANTLYSIFVIDCIKGKN